VDENCVGLKTKTAFVRQSFSASKATPSFQALYAVNEFPVDSNLPNLLRGEHFWTSEQVIRRRPPASKKAGRLGKHRP